MNILRHMTVFAAALLLAAPVSAHHSDAGMDMESTVTIEGTVKEFAWRNPHVYVIVETEQSGEPVDWELQMGLVHTSTRRGWTRDSLSPGDQVSIRANVMTNGRPRPLTILCPPRTRNRHVPGGQRLQCWTPRAYT